MESIELQVNSREVLGKKVKRLRNQGVTPVHLYGHGVKSLALQCETAQLRHILSAAGKTRVIDLKVDKVKKAKQVLVREVQVAPASDRLLHVDFYQVKATEKLTVAVPIVLVGEAPALKVKGNTLIRELDTMNVECLPGKIPTSIEVDLSVLVEAEQAVRVGDVPVSGDVKVLEDPEQVVVKVAARLVERVEEVAPEEEVAEEAPEAAQPAAEESSGEGE